MSKFLCFETDEPYKGLPWSLPNLRPSFSESKRSRAYEAVIYHMTVKYSVVCVCLLYSWSLILTRVGLNVR